MICCHLDVRFGRVRYLFRVRMPKPKTVKALLEKSFSFGFRVSKVETNASEPRPLCWELGHSIDYNNFCY